MRRFLILAHLLMASLVAPAFILLATSGGLYLIGIKGSQETQEIEISGSLDFSSKNLEADVRALLASNSIDHEFEYIKSRGQYLQTRPTSRTYLELSSKGGKLTLAKQSPNLQKSMIELHKGHGPSSFKTYQKLVAICLLLVVLSGLWMGLANKALRGKTLGATVLGLAVFLLLALG